MKRLDRKLANIRNGSTAASDFILADAKDADMAFGLTAPGPQSGHCHHGYNESEGCWKTLAQYRDQIRAVIAQDIVDIMLLSASNLEHLGMGEGLFRSSAITPAARANDTSDVWAVRGGNYPTDHPSRSFRTATLDHIKYGRLTEDHSAPFPGADLGLYSITFTNNIDWDYKALLDFHDFRIEAERKRFRYFLEVFNPNVNPGIPDRKVARVPQRPHHPGPGRRHRNRPAGVPQDSLQRPRPARGTGVVRFPAGGGDSRGKRRHHSRRLSIDPRRAQTRRPGRALRPQDQPLRTPPRLHRVPAPGGRRGGHPVDAVKAYHDVLQKSGIKPHRHLQMDLKLTTNRMSYR
jgi:hypothetical protein